MNPKWTLPAVAALAIALATPSTAAMAAPAAPAAATGTAPVMRLIKTTPLPDVSGGDFDHFAVDLPGDRLYVTAEKHKSVEIFALRSGAHLGSVGGFGNPHSIYLVPDLHQLFVADGDAGAVRILDTRTRQLGDTIPTRPGPDAALYDPQSRNLFVVSGGEPDHAADTDIGIISVDRHRLVDRMVSPANNTESMAIDHARNRLFANLRDTHQIGVFDLATRKLVATWDLPGLLKNTPLAFDAATHRLFVVCRDPAMLVVIDSDSGAILSQVPSVTVADDMTFDAAHGRIFVSGAGGLAIYRRVDRDHFAEVQRLDTKGGKTSTYVAPLDRFFVIHTKDGAIDAGLDIYAVSPAGAGATFGRN